MAEGLDLNLTHAKRYELRASQPCLELPRKMALALGVSTDSLLFERTGRTPAEDLRLQFEVVSQFDAEDRAIVKTLFEGMLLKNEAKHWRQVSSARATAAPAAKVGAPNRNPSSRRTPSRASVRGA